MKTLRIVFIIAAIPFTLLVLLSVLVAQNTSTGSHVPFNGLILFCGSVYVYGSIGVLRHEMPLALLVGIGFVLNVFGACAWASAFDYPGGQVFGGTGVVLALSWIAVIIQQYREERH